MEDMHLPDGVKDEVTLLESNRNKVFWQRILIHNQWLEKKWCHHVRKKALLWKHIGLQKDVRHSDQKFSYPRALSSALNNKHPGHYLRK